MIDIDFSGSRVGVEQDTHVRDEHDSCETYSNGQNDRAQEVDHNDKLRADSISSVSRSTLIPKGQD